MIAGRKTKVVSLAEKFRNELLEERRPKDSPVLSVRELAEHFSICTETANRILNLLVEKDFLYRKPKSGTFIKHDPPVIPVIAYAGFLPGPGSGLDPLANAAEERLLDHFNELGITPRVITYHTLRNRESAERELADTNGLMINTSFIDDTTLKTLWEYPGRIAVFNSDYILNNLSCSQVIPDFSGPLLEFNRLKPFDSYDKILIIKAYHRNGIACAEICCRILHRLQIAKDKIEVVPLDGTAGVSAYLKASHYFSRRGTLPENTLIITVSEYYAQGIREVYSKRSSQPDILTFDNLESHENNTGEPGYFTAIDRKMEQTVCRTLDLLVEQLKTPGIGQEIVRIPAELVIRQSVKGIAACIPSDEKQPKKINGKEKRKKCQQSVK